jgi:PAS domain S-box-containing protein
MGIRIVESSAPDPFFSLSPDMLCVVGVDGYFQRLNPRWSEVLGLSEEQLLARPLVDFVHPDDRAATVLTRSQFENRFASGDGSYRWLSWRNAPGQLGSRGASLGREAAFYCVVRDITERKLAERRLLMQLAITRALTGANTIAEVARGLLQAIGEAESWQAGSFWRLHESSQELRCEAFWHEPSRKAAEFERITWRTHFPPGEGIPGCAFQQREAIWIVDISKDERFHRAFWAAKDGLRAACAFPILAGAEVVGVIELLGRSPREPDPLLHEMMDAMSSQVGQFIKRKDAEDALKTAQERLRSVLAHAPIILFAMDSQGSVVLSEGRGLGALGLAPKQVIGQSVFDLYKDIPEVIEHTHRALRGEAFTILLDLPGPSGPNLFYETRYTPVFGEGGELVEVIGVATDITERHKAEVALRQSEARLVEADRLASIGALAAGVAHEINNPLSYVLLNLDMVIRDLTSAAPHQGGDGAGGEGARFAEIVARLREARAGVDRVGHIVQDLKAFSRVDTDRRGLIDVRRVLDETIDLASNEIRHRARLVRAYGEVPMVSASASRLSQVFLNLLVNAAQSMSEGEAEQNEIRVGAAVDGGGRVVVEVADTGSGMTPEVLARIFDPFFTTKPAGVGTGLGLSICHGIISSLGGAITVQSRVGEGTTFRVALPPADEKAAEVSCGIDAAPTMQQPPGSSSHSPSVSEPSRPRLLVVDDEPVLATALGRALTPAFDVTVLGNGRDALRLLREDPRFDVILCDLIMPELTGMDLYEELSRTRPALADRIIFMTGGTFTARARNFLEAVPNPALDKPFDITMLHAILEARVRRS